VRRHAKASTAGSARGQATIGPARSARGRLALIVACPALVVIAVLLASGLPFSPPPAYAGTVTDERPFLFSFNGADATGGAFGDSQLTGVAVDNATGAVYVANASENLSEGPRFVSRFNAEGEAEDFSATGTSSLFGPPGSLFSNVLRPAVDNSGGAGQGRLLVSNFGVARIDAFAASGSFLWSFIPPAQTNDVSVDAGGHPWVVSSFGGEGATQYEATGSPPPPTGCSIPLSGSTDAIDVDANDNVYREKFGEILKYTNTGACAFTESVLDSNARDVYADQSSPAGHIFTAQTGSFSEYSAAGAELGSYGADYLSTGAPRIAYNPSKDWVYVAQRFESHPVVAVFGPVASGAVPDVTEIGTPSSVGISTAHLSGKVNPKNVGAKAHFEWKRPSESWAAAATSPAQALPVDETEHSVEFDTNGLRGNTTYEVRLVTTNDADKLHALSAEAKEFTTETAAEAPAVTIEPVTSFSTTTASVEGTVDPRGDTADWRVQVQPGCSGEFSSQALQSFAEASETPEAVAYDLTGLLPSERYCVRIAATNSFGTTTSEAEEFTTASIVPDEVETAPAAPRLDTSARLNARVNPQGEELTYRFEYSEDGGATWQALPDQTDTSEAREQIVVGEELTGLSPDTPYSYRFSAENPGGPASLQGGELAFTTRTSAEVTLPAPRGIELVNSPNKGNQNVFPNVLDSPVTEDGEKALWRVSAAGSPNGHTSTGDTFLSRRTPIGWRSQTLMPPPAQQLGGGSWEYVLRAATPDFSRFAFITGRPGPTLSAEAYVRLDTAQHEEVLLAPATGASGEISEGGDHLVLVNTARSQLEDIGTPGAPDLISIMPDGSESECFDLEDTFEIGNRGAGVSLGFGYRRTALDASRVYFQVEANGACSSGPLGLYQRNRETEQTTLIDPGADGNDVEMIRATPDGRSIYFTTWSQLSPADENDDADVYRWDEATDESTCLTCAAAADAAVRSGNSVMVSDDFSHVYFESKKQLVPGRGMAGDGNVYALSGNEIRFVTNLDSNAPKGALSSSGAHARLSADGNVLVFQTLDSSRPLRSLTSDDVAGSCPDLVAFEGSSDCFELYRYDDRDGSVECVSCRRGGQTTHSFGSRKGPARGLEGEYGLSADGSTVIFPTAQALVPSDVNGSYDIYEWRNGVQRLITDGVRDFGDDRFSSPRVTGVDADGSDVFFTVVAPGLTGFEEDGLVNLYDGRIGGGFPRPTPPAHCDGDSCQGPLRAAPPGPPAGSSTYSGSGNLKPRGGNARCARKHGRARKRCLRRHARHRKQGGGPHKAARAHRNKRRAG
jgi:hypothetical protein